MAESLIIIFESFWNFIGTLVIIYSLGYATALPFYWYYKLKQIKLNKSTWTHQ